MCRKYLLFTIGFLFAMSLFAQNKGSIEGTISTEEGEPASFIPVVLKGTGLYATTNQEGYYSLQNIPSGTYELVVSGMGYKTESKTLSLASREHLTVNFTLTTDISLLDEVVIETNRFMDKKTTSVAKLPLKSLENPQVYSTISSVVLKKQNVMNLEDAMQNAAGVTKIWDATGRPGGGSLFASRGFTTSPTARNGMASILSANIDMANVERLEIIKGPSATLFGSIITSYGGIINRVTEKPYSVFGGSASFSTGSFGYYRVAADVNTPLDEEGKLNARFNLALKNQNSFQDAGYRKSYFFAPAFSYTPNERLEITVEGEFTGSKGNSNGGNFMYFYTPSQVKSGISAALSAQGVSAENISAILSQAPSTFKEAFGTNRIDELNLDYKRSFLSDDVVSTNTSANVFGEINYKLSDHWTSRSLFSTGQSRTQGYMSFQYLIPNMLPAFIQSLPNAPNFSFGKPGHDYVARAVWEPKGHSTFLEIQQNFTADYSFGNIRNRTVIGLDYSSFNQRLSYTAFYGEVFGIPMPYIFDVVPSNGEIPNYNDYNHEAVTHAFATRPKAPSYQNNFNNRVYSAYVNDVANITDYVVASAGLRVDHFRSEEVYNPVTGKYGDSYDQTEISTKFGLIVQPIDDKVSLFGNYQNGFNNVNGTDFNGDAFTPEHAFQWEAGMKFRLFDDKLTGTISYYDILVKDIVRIDPNHTGYQIQNGERSSKGYEIELLANPLQGWMIMAGYGHNESKMLKANPNVEGLRPAGTGPEDMFNFWTNYTFTQNTLKGFGIGVGVNYSGESFAYNLNQDGALILPSYTLVNATLSYDTPSYRFALNLNNITNEKYWMGWSNMIPQMPRQLIGSVTFKF